MKFVFAFLILSVAFSTGFAQQRVADFDKQQNQIVETEKKSFRWNKDERVFNTAASGNFDISYYRCEWSIDPAIRFINGKVTSYFTITSATDKIIFDLSDTLNVDSITYHAVPVSFQRTGNDALQIQFPSSLPTGTIDSISIYYNGTPRLTTSYSAFSQSTHNGVPVIWTISEPFGSKEWWPCKNGLTTKVDSLDIFITCPDIYSGTTNGVISEEIIYKGIKTTHYRHRYPIATYLVGIAVTNYVRDIDSAQTAGKTIPLIMNAYPEYADYYKTNTYYAKQSMQKLSELFGEYPFSKEHYSQTQTNSSGGMEHQTNSFIGGGVYNQLVAHELGHHWFGDLVTCGSWQHIWLNEGFANYIQFIYVQNFDTALINAHLSYYLNLVTSKPGGSVFVPDTSLAGRIFDNRLTYAKGGYVVHMLRWVLGDSLFFKGIRQYLKDPLLKNKFAVTADLQRNLEQVSGKNLQSFFQKWIYGEGYPNYNCMWTQNKNNWAKVQINQTTSSSTVSFYDMPVQLKFHSNNRDTSIIVNNVINGEIFWINVGFAADTMLIDPDYWILAKGRVTKKIPSSSTIENDLKIYPNPASQWLNIQFLNPSVPNINVQLYNITGQLLYSKQINLTGNDELIAIPVNGFAKGTYVVRISYNSSIVTKKIIIR